MPCFELDAYACIVHYLSSPGCDCHVHYEQIKIFRGILLFPYRGGHCSDVKRGVDSEAPNPLIFSSGGVYKLVHHHEKTTKKPRSHGSFNITRKMVLFGRVRAL